MNDYEKLWNDLLCDTEESDFTNNIEPLLREQCGIVERLTNGKVRGEIKVNDGPLFPLSSSNAYWVSSFKNRESSYAVSPSEARLARWRKEGAKLEKIQLPIKVTARKPRSLAASIERITIDYVRPPALSGVTGVRPSFTRSMALKDAGSLYSERILSFYVVSDEYRFRLFKLRMEPLYPVTMTIDEGIFDEIGAELPVLVSQDDGWCSVRVSSDDELMGCFVAVLKSRKLKYILKEMLEQVVVNNASAESEAVVQRQSEVSPITVNASSARS